MFCIYLLHDSNDSQCLRFFHRVLHLCLLARMHYPVCLTSAFATYRAQSGCCLLHDLHFNHEKIHHMQMHMK